MSKVYLQVSRRRASKECLQRLGLENVQNDERLVRIEYMQSYRTQLWPTLETKSQTSIAGQINEHPVK